MELIPHAAQIPVHLDPSHAPYTEVPSSSAVFAHTQTTPGAAPGSRPIDRATWVIVALSCAMAVIGVALGAYALVRRSAQTEHPMIAPTATGGPSAGAMPSAGASGAPSTSLPAAQPEVAASATATASGSATATATGTSAPTSVTTTAPTSAPAFTAKPPAVLPPPGGAPTVRKPGGKPSCDPPYTVDDVGHRHYKPECMGLE